MAIIKMQDNPRDFVLKRFSIAIQEAKGSAKVFFDWPGNLYLTADQAAGYLKIMSESSYSAGFHGPLLRLIQKRCRSIVEQLSYKVIFIDLGPGYPDKSLPLLNALLSLSEGHQVTYCPVDINKKFLEMAADVVRSLSIEVCPIQMRFEDLPGEIEKQFADTDASRVVLLGLTFMNFPGRQILDILGKVAGARGLALIASELSERSKVAELLKAYQGPEVEEFNRKITRLLGIPDDHLQYIVSWVGSVIQVGFRLLRDTKLANGITITSGRTIITATSRRYSRVELRELGLKYFQEFDLFSDPEGRVALACLLRARTKE